MNTKRGISAVIGALVLALSLALADVGFTVVRQNIDALDVASREPLLWSTLQVELEFQRFRTSLASLALTDQTISPSTPSQVNQRFDILWSRLHVVSNGDVGRRIRAYDQSEATLSDLQAVMQTVERDVTMISPDDHGAIARINAQMAPFSDRLRALSRRIVHGEAAKSANMRVDLSGSSKILFYMSGFITFASLLLLFLFRRDSIYFRTLARTNERLLHEAQQAEHLKSRFMTMMSHELRTPLNGVLGLMTLMGQTKLSEKQAELVTQAGRSGRRMNDLLQDLMDYSELGAGNPLASKVMVARDVIDRVRHNLAQDDAFVALEMTVKPGHDIPVRTDARLIALALDHLLKFMADRAGIDHLLLSFVHDDGEMVIDILPSGADPDNDWQSEFLMGAPADHADRFATTSIGPAVSQQIVSQMDGRLGVYRGDGAVGLRICIPAARLETVPSVGLVSASASVRALCVAALEDAFGKGVKLVSQDVADIVLWNASGEDAHHKIAAFAQRNPDALIIGLGSGAPGAGFDYWIDISSDLSALQARLARYDVEDRRT